MWILPYLFLLHAPLSSTENSLLVLHQTAEAAMRKGEYAEAAIAYKDLLDKISSSPRTSLHWKEYSDTSLRYAEALISLDRMREAETLLNNLLSISPAEFHPSILLARARTTRGITGLIATYRDIQQIQATLPSSHWPSGMKILFHTTEMTLNEYCDQLAQKAHRYNLTQNHKEALNCYQELEAILKQGGYPKANKKESLLPKKIDLHLATTLYRLAEYEQVISFTKRVQEIEDTIDCELLYLVAKAHKKALDYQSAISLLEVIVASGDEVLSQEYLQALYELATLYEKAGNRSEATKQFLKIVDIEKEPSRYKLLSTLSLAHIYLEEKKYAELKGCLSFLKVQAKAHPFLKERLLFLEGECAFAKKEYQEAKGAFKEALLLSRRHKEKITLYLVQCDLFCGEESAETTKWLQSLSEGKDHKEAFLYQALLFFRAGEKEKGMFLLEEHQSSFSDEEKLIAHLLKARALKSDESLLLALESPYIHFPSYSYGWFLRGLFALEQGLITPALAYFETAFTLSISSPMAKSSFLPFLIPEDQKRASFLVEQERQKSPTSQELPYIEALIYGCSEENPEEKKSLLLCETLIEGSYRDQALYLLGSFYYQQEKFAKAKEYFLQVISDDPLSPLAAACWYWAAESEEQLAPNSLCLADYRAHLFEKYPETLFGAEAYFKFFPLDAYIEGDPKALSHLAKFSLRFPHSYLQVAAYYLLSLHTETKEEKKKQLLQALAAYNQLPLHSKQQEGAHYFQAISLLALSKGLGHDPNQVISLLKPLLKDLMEKEVRSFSLTLVECQWLLAKAYVKEKKYHKAQQMLLLLLKTHQKWGIDQGEFLTLAWQEQGDLAFLKGDPLTASANYQLALKSGSAHLQEEQKKALTLKYQKCMKILPISSR